MTTATAPASAGDATRLFNAAPGQRLAGAESVGFDAGTRTFEVVAATETPCKFRGYEIGLDEPWFYEILDCSPESVDFSEVRAGNAPLLDSHGRHSMRDRLGVVQEASIQNRQIIAVARLGESDLAREVESELSAGVKLKASVGYRRDELRLERMEGHIPVYRTTKWKITELSLVPIAADPNAGVRADGDLHPCTIRMETSAMTQANGTGQAAPVKNGGQNLPGNPAPVVNPAPVAEATAGRAAPADQPAPVPIATVAHFSPSAALEFVDQARAFSGEIATRAQELVASNERGEITTETARSELSRAMAEAQRANTGGLTNGARAVEITADERDKFMQGAMNSIFQRAGVSTLITTAAASRGEKYDVDPGEFRGLRNADIARMCIDRAGIRSPGYGSDLIVTTALTAVRAGFNATSDFPILLENAMHKVLQAQYEIQPRAWRNFCGIGSVNDFRPHPRFLRGTFGVLRPRNEAGEFEQRQIPDGAKELISAAAKGFIIGLTREAIINDDMGAFNFLALEMGTAAGLSVEVDVFNLLTANAGAGPNMQDGNPLFHASHGNIMVDSGVPTVERFDKMAQAMALQKDVSGNEFLDIRPEIWLGPVNLRGLADVVNSSEYDHDDTSNAKFMKPNKSRNLFQQVIGSPRLSGTPWYGFANPLFAPAIEVAFVKGQQEPTLDSQEGWRNHGIQWKVVYEYGVAALNWRSIQKNNG